MVSPRISDGQLNFPPAGVYADPVNPIAVWRANFEVTDFTPRQISFRTETRTASIYPQRESATSEQPPWAEGAGAIRVVPAPGAVALGLLAIAACGRRRASSAANTRPLPDHSGCTPRARRARRP